MTRCIVMQDPAHVESTAAERLVRAIAITQAERERCALALSGGTTPRGIYERLATASQVDWRRLHVFWVDERAVPSDSQHSNEHLARTALLDRVPIPEAQVHPMPGAAADLDAGASDYESLLCALLGRPPRLDVVLLGLGADAHTASLFPGAAAAAEGSRFVVATPAPTIAPRLTLTIPTLRAARAVVVALHGADKAAALHRTLYGRCDPARVPLHALRDRELTYVVDRAAAAALGASDRLP